MADDKFVRWLQTQRVGEPLSQVERKALHQAQQRREAGAPRLSTEDLLARHADHVTAAIANAPRMAPEVAARCRALRAEVTSDRKTWRPAEELLTKVEEALEGKAVER